MAKLFIIGFLIPAFYSCTGYDDQKPDMRSPTQAGKAAADTPHINYSIDSLAIFLREEKFNAGAADWEGYTGAHDPKIKSALSAIVNNAISDFITLIKEQKATKENLYKSAYKHWNKVLDIELELDTDESEVAYMYFAKLFRLVGLTFDEAEIRHYKD